MLSQIPFCLETEVAVLASEGSHIGVGPDVFLEHGRFLAPDAAGVADVLAPAAAPDVGVVVVSRLEPSLHCPHWLAVVNLLELKNINSLISTDQTFFSNLG